MSNQEQLRSFFKFDDNDLLANQQGQFSAQQKQRLQELDQSSSRFILGLAIVSLAATVWRIYVLATAAGDWVSPFILLAVSIWLFSGVFKKVDTEVKRTQGVANFIKTESKTGSVTDLEVNRTKVSSYTLWVGGVAFLNVNPALIEYMEGRSYTIYYTSSTNQILSIESVPEKA